MRKWGPHAVPPPAACSAKRRGAGARPTQRTGIEACGRCLQMSRRHSCHKALPKSTAPGQLQPACPLCHLLAVPSPCVSLSIICIEATTSLQHAYAHSAPAPAAPLLGCRHWGLAAAAVVIALPALAPQHLFLSSCELGRWRARLIQAPQLQSDSHLTQSALNHPSA